MLGKLIKYDFKAMAKMMIPVYIAMIVLTAVTSLMTKFKAEETMIFGILITLFITVVSGSAFVTLVACVKRFVDGLLKNEGYLSFALPVKTSTHILAKVINALIWCVFEGIVLGICFFVMLTVLGGVRDFARFLAEFLARLDVNALWFIIRTLTLMMLELAAFICLIFTAYSVSHLFGRRSTAVATIVVVLIVVLRGFLTPSGWIRDFDLFHMEWVWYVTPVLTISLYTLLTWYILDRRLNLE